jgi:Bacterial regulatory protein, Fis family
MNTKNSPVSSGIKKKAMIEALEANLGNITRASKQAGIKPRTFYRWLKEDEDFHREVYEMKHVNNSMMKDSILYAALKKIEQGDTAVLNQLLRIYLKKLPDEIEMISKTVNPNPIRVRLKIAPHPNDFYAKDPMTQLAVKRYMQDKEKDGKLGELRQDLVQKYKDGTIGQGEPERF